MIDALGVKSSIGPCYEGTAGRYSDPTKESRVYHAVSAGTNKAGCSEQSRLQASLQT